MSLTSYSLTSLTLIGRGRACRCLGRELVAVERNRLM
jgi:hypothetical protein